MPTVKLKVSAALLAQVFALDTVAARFEVPEAQHDGIWPPGVFTFDVYVPGAPADAVEMNPVYHRDPATRRLSLQKIIWYRADGTMTEQSVDVEDGTAIGDLVDFTALPTVIGDGIDGCVLPQFDVALGCACPARFENGAWHRFHRDPCVQPGVITVNLRGTVLDREALAGAIEGAFGGWRRRRADPTDDDASK